MKTKMQIGNKVRWEKFNTRFTGVVRNVESHADAKTWYEIKITGKKPMTKVPDKRFSKFRIGQKEFNYIHNMKNLVVLK